MFHSQQIRQNQQQQYPPHHHYPQKQQQQQQYGGYTNNHSQQQQQQPRNHHHHTQYPPSQHQQIPQSNLRPMQRSFSTNQVPQQRQQFHPEPLHRAFSSNSMPQQNRQPHPQQQRSLAPPFQHKPQQQSSGAPYGKSQQQLQSPSRSMHSQSGQGTPQRPHHPQKQSPYRQQSSQQAQVPSPSRSTHSSHSVQGTPQRYPQSASSSPYGQSASIIHHNQQPQSSPYGKVNSYNNDDPYGVSHPASQSMDDLNSVNYARPQEQQQSSQAFPQQNTVVNVSTDTRFKKYSKVQEETYQEYKQRMRNEGTPLTRGDRRLLNQNKAYQNSHDADDLNAPSNNFNADDLNDSGNYVYGNNNEEEEGEIDEDEEELEDIKCELSFTRDKTVESTERTLAMAREAAMSGKNTLEMLSNQSEKLFGVEDNLAMAKVVNRQGTATAIELRTAGNLIRAPKNPFNKKSRLRKKEEEARKQMEADQEIRDRQREDFQASQRSLNQGLNGSDHIDGQYNNQGASEADYKRYMYEGEGEEAEKQEDRIANNLSEISMYASRLKGMAVAQGEEIDRQQIRIRHMQQNVNKLDVDVNRNTDRLRRIVG